VHKARAYQATMHAKLQRFVDLAWPIFGTGLISKFALTELNKCGEDFIFFVLDFRCGVPFSNESDLNVHDCHRLMWSKIEDKFRTF